MKKRTAAYWKEKLHLTGHVEGGAFREVYRGKLQLSRDNLTSAHQGDRAIATSIYFLLEYGDFSAFHRIASDELWHFYDGDTLSIYEITSSGELKHHLLGMDMEGNASLQVLIPAGSWFGSVVEIEAGFTLCGCTVAPGFDFEDFELADRTVLTEAYPDCKELIERLTRI